MTNPLPILTPEEEITLRRVAFGESPTRTLRPADVTRLRALRLIADGKDGLLCLTSNGRASFESLAKPVMAERPPAGRLADEVDRLRRMKTGDA